MPRAMKASEPGLESHYKVRVVLPGVILHLASSTAPELRWGSDIGLEGAPLEAVDAEWIEDADYGDTIGFIDWAKVVAITWRYSE